MSLKIYIDFPLSENARQLLESQTNGHTLVFPSIPAESVLAKSHPDPALLECDVVFGQPEPAEIEKAKRLKWIQISSSGITRYDNSDFRSHVAKKRIPVCNSASVYNDACADHLLAFMLAQSRCLPQGLASSDENGSPPWLALRDGSVPLRGQSAIILGYGAIGARLVELLAPYRMKLVAYRRKARGDEAIPVTTAENLPEALASADHVINILPDSPATQGFFDAARFAQCKPGSVFYNIGRGTTVDQEALANSLRSAHTKAAWLDVTDPEPLPTDHRLRSAPNCFITPHVAGGHLEESTTCVSHFLENLQRFVEGRELLDRVM
ncbi:D-2-hydroxyacid dehydrogenase [Pelagicoccus sp. SDUM812003]|uniref:D-2-hydroxyacid dehydrogenase n=1 Tax=Pelagicoccus sp. SDUM812003 TaxID=3041267 RepID=UPI00280D1C69|nr:D-2-hydroxyacid dehydrogenase [Pelagicoccus sp. SDUM812003]MDQ8203956.1 D-2-hydroxyacid dehydrogenase [Pelagicoccus sp. SDUM812003]